MFSGTVVHRAALRCWLLAWLFCLCALFPLRGFSAADEAPLVSFDYLLPGADPEHYLISVSAGKPASYDAEGRGSQWVEGTGYHVQFTLSPATWNHILELSAKAGYFARELESPRKGMAAMGRKTLTYRDAHRANHAVYNYSSIPAVEKLTDLFEGLALSLECGRRLEYDYRYQKLALDEELKKIEELAESHELLEPAVLAPVLARIADDATVLNVARSRALRLLQRFGT